MSDVWNLIKNGDYEAACREADSEFLGSASILSLRNKVLALLCLGRFQEAINVGRTVIQLQGGDTDSDFIFLGTSYWLLGMRDDAIMTWNSAVNTKYTDAAGGVEIQLLLYYASIKNGDFRLKKSSQEKLSALCKQSSASSWPGPLAQYISGKITKDQLFSKTGAHPLLRAKQMCQAAFYVGLACHLDGDDEGCFKYMQQSIDQGPVSLMKQEYYIARLEFREQCTRLSAKN